MAEYKEVERFFDSMPVGARYNVKPEQIEQIKRYMLSRKWDGGLHFTADWKTIYKTTTPDDVPEIKWGK